jgi:monoamine oxidase
MVVMYDYIIIGGGIGGLYAALQCIRRGNSVLLIEKSVRLGGRIHTIYENKYQYEAGAGRFSPRQHVRLARLLKHYGLHKVANEKTLEFASVGADTNVISYDDVQVKLRRVISVIHKDIEKCRSVTFKKMCVQVLGSDEADLVKAAFGYNAEFELMNAVDACDMFDRDFTAGVKYYSCKEGLSALVDAIEKDLVNHGKGKGQCKIMKETVVSSVEKDGESFIVNVMGGNNGIYVAKAVIAALPQQALMELCLLPMFTSKQRKLLRSVRGVSLHRIYGGWESDKETHATWFSRVAKTTTNNHIRQFIPMNRASGLAMASYSDTMDADYWKKVADRGTQVLSQTLGKYLSAMFKRVVELPSWVQSYYWPAGVHVWKPGIDSKKVSEEVMHIMGRNVPFYVVGEAYSRHQGWIEGALESVDDLAKYIWGGRGGGCGCSRSGGADIAALKKKFPGIEWVLLTYEGITHVINVTEWKKIHPGGNVYDKYLYGKGDLSAMFKDIPYHFEAGSNGKLKPDVLAAIKKYTIDTINF